jgi:Flp pilus assembly protein TadD
MHFVEGLGKDRAGALDAARALGKVAEDSGAPTIARATALERLGHYPAPHVLPTLRRGLASNEPLLVYGAVLGTAQLSLAQRATLLLPVLAHPARAVRVAAGRSLAGVAVAQLPESARAQLARAFDEVEQSFAVRASRPETHVERSAFLLARGMLDEARRALETALRLEPCLAEAHLNLAELARVRGDEPGAERAIRAALACHPDSAAVHHAPGLWRGRAGRARDAMASLKKAVELAPADTRFHYVLAVALHGSGERDEAIRVLDKALEARANEPSILQALASYLREAGQSERAADARRKLDTVLRD